MKLRQAPYIDYFLRPDKEPRSLASLDENLTEALKDDLGSKHLSIILYHAAFLAEIWNVYGDRKRAKSVIASHIQAWTDQAIRDKHPDPFVIPHMLNGFEILRMRPPERFLEYVSHVGAKLMPRAGGHAMLDLFSATASLGLTHDEAFLQAMQRQILQIAPKMSGGDLYDLFHYMAIIDAVTARSPKAAQFGWKNTFDQLYDHPRINDVLARNCEHEPQRKLLDSYYWFRDQKLKAYPKEWGTASSFESWVGKQFHAAGAKLTSSVRVRHSGHKVDLAASFNGTSFLIECDGPSHFVYAIDSNKVYLNGNTLFQTALIERRTPNTKLIRVPYVTYEANAESPHVWAGLLKQIEHVKPKGYLVNTQGTLSSLVTRCALTTPQEAYASSPS